MLDPQQRQTYLAAMGIAEWVPRNAPALTPADALPPSPAAALDWAALAAAVATCERCELHRGRTQTVFGVGHRAPQWLVVGEAPGREEDHLGEPFVGRAGQLLNAMLAALGLSRDEVFIANILKCRPPSNRDPQVAEITACAGWLARQIELLAPQIILCVGRIAAQSLLGTPSSLAKLRGQPHAYGPNHIPVVVTYHPAYLLRSPLEKRQAWQDLLLARRVLAGEQ
ncbi:MAG: uracil-DNA glycosylase [Gammaproteobacteria bacterium]|nr:uracil-DNA glycosylase [Gammaproteobacteria bacterium]